MYDPSWLPSDWGRKLFQYRDVSPVPLVILMWIVADPTPLSATLGTLFILAGEVLRVYAVGFIGGKSRTRSESLGPQLVVNGPFRWVRNPLYVGNAFITAGFGVYSGQAWFFICLAILFAVQYLLIVQYEEKLLEEKFGEEYLSYKEKVPAWIPKGWMGFQEEDVWDFSRVWEALQCEKRTLTGIFLTLGILLLFKG